MKYVVEYYGNKKYIQRVHLEARDEEQARRLADKFAEHYDYYREHKNEVEDVRVVEFENWGF